MLREFGCGPRRNDEYFKSMPWNREGHGYEAMGELVHVRNQPLTIERVLGVEDPRESYLEPPAPGENPFGCSRDY